MYTCQVRFKVVNDEYPSEYGGIYVEDALKSYVICGCCGTVFTMDAVEILEKYDWIDLSAEIIGG